MRKLRLNIDELQIESFETDTVGGRGTLRGQEDTAYATDCAVCGTGNWCAGQSTAPCQAGTYVGHSCDTTCAQLLCGCTYGGENNGTCDAACNSAAGNCPTDYRYGC